MPTPRRHIHESGSGPLLDGPDFPQAARFQWHIQFDMPTPRGINTVRHKKMTRLASIVGLMGLVLVGCHMTSRESLCPRLQPFMGKQVTLVGIAEPRKSGAALRGDDFYVWLPEIDSWPIELSMKRVEVRGVLSEDHGLPVISGNEDPPVQGIPVPNGTDLREASRRLILLKATWRIIE